MPGSTGPDLNTYIIPEVELGDTFNYWRDTTNTMIYKLNKLRIYDAVNGDSIGVTYGSTGAWKPLLQPTITSGHTFSILTTFAGGITTSNAFVSSGLTVGGNLTVGGGSTFSTRMNAQSISVAAGVTVTGNLTVSGGSTFSSRVDAQSIAVAAGVTVAGNFTVVGGVSAGGFVFMSRGLTVAQGIFSASGLTVGGNSTFVGGVTFDSVSNFTGVVRVNGGLTANTVDVTGAARFSGGATASTLDVTGVSRLNGGVTASSATVTGNLIVSGGSTFSGRLDAANIAVATGVTVSGNMTVVGGISAGGFVFMSRGLTVAQGIFVASGLTVSGNSTFGSTAAFNGSALFNAGVTASSLNVSGNLIVSGGSTFSGRLDAANIAVATGVTVSGNMTVVGGISAGGFVFMSRGLTVAQGIFVASGLTVSGNSTFVGGVTFESTSTFSGVSRFNGGLTANTVDVTGAARFSGGATANTLDVTGVSKLNGAVTITGTSTFLGGVTFNSTSDFTGAARFNGGATASTLNVTGASRLNGGVTAATLDVSGVSKMSGNVSIGSSSSPVQRLVVTSGIAGGLPVVSGNPTTTSDANTSFRITGTGLVDVGGLVDGSSWIQSRSASNYAVNQNILFQPSGGNVGVGVTTSPIAKLHVEDGDLVVQRSASTTTVGVSSGSAAGLSQVRFTNDANNTGNIIYSGSSNTTYGGGSSLVMWNVSGTTLGFGTSNALRMVLAGVCLGIGTASPTSRLSVISASTNDAVFGTNIVNSLSIGRSSSEYSGIGYNTLFTPVDNVYGYRGVDTISLIRFTNGGFDFSGTTSAGVAGATTALVRHMTITNTSRVGIGTASPGASLDVRGTVNVGVGTSGAVFGLSGEMGLRNRSPILFYDLDSSNYVGFRAADSVGSNVTWTLPSTDGANGHVLSTNASGILSWKAADGVTGTDMQVQYNQGGAPGATSSFLFHYGGAGGFSAGTLGVSGGAYVLGNMGIGVTGQNIGRRIIHGSGANTARGKLEVVGDIRIPSGGFFVNSNITIPAGVCGSIGSNENAIMSGILTIASGATLTVESGGTLVVL